MYAGHAGLALYAKARRPGVPIALLVPVAFAPDWIQWTLAALHITQEPSISHSLTLVLGGASVVAVGYWLVTNSRADAAIVWLTYLSHWPADFITATKALWPYGPEFGLNLYQHAVVDVIVESVVIVVCWMAYRRSLSASEKQRLIGWAIPVGLVGLQIGFVLIQYPAVKDPIKQMIGN